MQSDNILRSNIAEASAFLLKAAKKEWVEQGHNASGKTLESFEVTDKLANGDLVIGLLTNDPAIYQDRGVRANRIRYNPEVLRSWAERIKPNASDREITSFIWAVRKTHEKEGMPSRGSFSFSDNGRRTEWTKFGVVDQEDKFVDLLNLFEYVEALIEEAFVLQAA